MSTNQAFIKAYRRDLPLSAAPAPTKPAAAAHVHRPVVAETVVAFPENSIFQSTVEIATASFAWPNADFVATPVVAPPAVEIPKSAPSYSPPRHQSPASHVPEPNLPAPHVPVSQSPVGKRPLSSFTPAPIDEPFLMPEPTFVPETTISAFRWPQVCRALWERHQPHYDQIAGLLLERLPREPSRGALVGIASLHAGDGATTTTLCLAIAMAARKRSVIVVDANYRAPRLAGILGVQPTTSWQDVLDHGLPVAEAVIRSEADGIDLLPLDLREPTAREPNGAKLASSVQTTITAGVLRYAYDMVIVDLGAILAPRSFATMSHVLRNMRIEAAIAVTDPKHAETDDFAVAGELLDESGCELLGLIENRAHATR
jgi:Mrp family chromosome partitioning ATPase